jgi:hypothetical protein
MDGSFFMAATAVDSVGFYVFLCFPNEGGA